MLASLVLLAGIVAKGLGVLAALIGFGFLLGAIVTFMIMRRFSHRRT